jgi:hypothetical protein
VSAGCGADEAAYTNFGRVGQSRRAYPARSRNQAMTLEYLGMCSCAADLFGTRSAVDPPRLQILTERIRVTSRPRGQYHDITARVRKISGPAARVTETHFCRYSATVRRQDNSTGRNLSTRQCAVSGPGKPPRALGLRMQCARSPRLPPRSPRAAVSGCTDRQMGLRFHPAGARRCPNTF